MERPVAAGCAASAGWPGSPRDAQCHRMIQLMLTAPITMKDMRQETYANNPATRSGVSALPSLAAACVMPWANPQLRAGIQSAIARVAVGKAAPSPKPNASRTATSEANPPARPVSDRCQAHDRSANCQRQPRPKAVADPATDKLEQCVGISKGRNRKAELGVRELQIRCYLRGNGGDIDPVHIEQQIHQAKHAQNAVGGATCRGPDVRRCLNLSLFTPMAVSVP